jgi:small-conductance mechanosensitive channel
MFEFLQQLTGFEQYIPLIRTLIILAIVFVAFNVILSLIKRGLLKKVKSKKQVSNIEIFSRVLRIIFLVVLFVMAFSSYYGSWTGFGIGVGLFSAALGWALQKPITGIAAWIMVVTKRPFEIGDRVIIGTVRGDVTDMTLSHIYLKEVGGLVAGEENSGRIILVPNSTLFEQNIINYTQQDEYTLDQVVTLITYESNLDTAMKIALESAKKHTSQFFSETKREPYVRTFFQPSGINVHVRYYAPAKRVQEFSSLITKEIFERIKKAEDVEIAYPHTEVVLRNKKIY